MSHVAICLTSIALDINFNSLNDLKDTKNCILGPVYEIKQSMTYM